MLTAQLIGKEQLKAKFENMPTKLHDELLKRITSLSLQIENHVKADKLSGQVLNSITGRLRNSIHSDVTDLGQSIVGRVYSAVPMPYARIHEYGGKTRAHIIEAINGKALKFDLSGQTVFARAVNHPGSVMPERSFLRSGLADYRDKIIKSFRDAVGVLK